jgi:hypothetical protein
MCSQRDSPGSHGRLRPKPCGLLQSGKRASKIASTGPFPEHPLPVSFFELDNTGVFDSSPGPGTAVAASDLDQALTVQIVVAWAGEGGEEPRLGWWQTDLVSEYGGEDLLRRLLPRTWPWAVLQAVRQAARRKDEQLRGKASDLDQLVTLYRFGFELDEQIEERLQAHKRSGLSPVEALPGLAEVLGGTLHQSWDRDQFQGWVEAHGPVPFEAAPTGRLLKGAMPAGLDRRVAQLVAALAPLADSYPLPHFRVKP